MIIPRCNEIHERKLTKQHLYAMLMNTRTATPRVLWEVQRKCSKNLINCPSFFPPPPPVMWWRVYYVDDICQRKHAGSQAVLPGSNTASSCSIHKPIRTPCGPIKPAVKSTQPNPDPLRADKASSKVNTTQARPPEGR